MAKMSKDDLRARDMLSLLLPGAVDDAVVLAEKMTARGKKHPVAFFVLGYAALMRGDRKEADQLFSRFKVGAVTDGYCAYQMALFDQTNESWERAERLYKRATALEDGFWEADYNLGNLYRDRHRYDLAFDAYTRALAVKPDAGATLFNAALTAEELGDFDIALDLYQKALPLEDDKAEVYCRMATCYHRSDRQEEAENYWAIVVDKYPDSPIYPVARVALFARDGDIDQVESWCRDAFARGIHHPLLYGRLSATLLVERDDVEAALDCVRTGLDHFPDNTALWQVMISSLAQQRRYRQLIAIGEELEQMGVTSPLIQQNIAVAFYMTGQTDISLDLFERLTVEFPDDTHVISSYLGVLVYSHQKSPEEIFARYCDLGAKISWGKEPLDIVPPHDRVRDKLRIGFVSQDLRRHAVVRHFLPRFLSRNRDRFTWYAYAHCIKKDDMTTTIKDLSDHWCEITDMSDLEAARRIADDGIDILLDLSGHTSGNRLGIFPYKPAPIQVSMIGSNVTTGLESMDYFEMHEKSYDPSQDNHFTEKFLLVKYVSDDEAVAVDPTVSQLFQQRVQGIASDPPQVKNGFVTYGCYSRLEKIEPRLMEVFVELLNQCDNAVLRMINISFADETLLRDTLAWFTERGIVRERLKFLPPVGLSLYLQSMSTLDFGLLSYPFAGGTVAHDMVTAGVPFVTRFGDDPQSCDGRRLLRSHPVTQAIDGVGDLAVRDYDRYLEVALTYGRDIDFLRRFRAGFQKFANEPEMDRFTPGLEKCFTHVWRERGGTVPWDS